LPGTDEILSELFQGRSKILHSEMQKTLILFAMRTNCHSCGINVSLYLFIKWVIKQTVEL